MPRLAVFLVLAFALAGCGSSKSSDEQPASTTSTSPPAMETTSTDCKIDGASKSAQKGSSSDTMYLTDVEFQAANCGSSVVFELEPKAQAPGYDVSYQPADTAKIEDASGNPVKIAGEAFLVVKLTPAMTAKIDGDQVTKTYTGPSRLAGGGPVTEIVKTGDFESVVTWVIGLDSERPFLAQAADGGLTVVIDVS